MNIVITCAGTGGHINPAIAIADIIKNKYNNCNISFIGTKNGMENSLVKKAGYEIYNVSAGKIHRKLTLKNIKNLYNAYRGYRESKKVLKELKPDLVIGTGGYICMSVMKAAYSLKIPYILHESNNHTGLSVKLLAKKAYKLMCGFEETCKLYSNAIYTGTPVKFNKKDYEVLNKKECKKELNITEDKVVFITFGSQGAKYLNIKLIDMLKGFSDENTLYILVTGNNNYEEVKEYIKSIKDKGIKFNIRIEKFVYEMDKMYKVADLCITRCGAMTINELILTNNPSILIPLPYAAENHQYYNGKIIEKINGGFVIEEKKLSSEDLSDKINNIFNNLEDMKNNLNKLYSNDVNLKIEKVISEYYEKRE